MSDVPDTQTRRDLLLVGCVALAIRLLFCWVVYPLLAPNFEAGDGYDEIARNWVAGHGYVLAGADAPAERLPLLPLFYAAHFALFGARDWPWQFSQSVLGAVSCVLVFVLAHRLADRRGGLLAATVCALHPALLLYTARPFTETLYTLLLLLLVRELVRPDWSMARSGALLGLQLLLKNTAVLHLLAWGPWLRRSPARVAGAGLIAVALLLPWVGWNLSHFGVPHLGSGRGGITLYHGVYISRHAGWTTPATALNRDAELDLWGELQRRGLSPSSPLSARNRLAGDLAVDWISTHPTAALGLWLRNLLLTWYLGRSGASMLLYALLHAALFAAAASGFRRAVAKPDATPLAGTCCMLLVAYTAFHAALQPAVRYVAPVVPLLVILSATASLKFPLRRRCSR